MFPWRAWHLFMVTTVLGSVPACSIPSPYPNLPPLEISLRYGRDNLCSVGVSPEIQLRRVPSATAYYRVQASNTEVLFQTPWRETLPATSRDRIPEGAGKTYVGPCIGDLEHWTANRGDVFRVEVLAMDDAGELLAYGQAHVIVRSPFETSRIEGENRPSRSTLVDDIGRTSLAPAPFPDAPLYNAPLGDLAPQPSR